MKPTSRPPSKNNIRITS